ncbi:hypothetical protein GOB86_05705 [Acetobacter lambici]|uniref:Uncharacterized protein n=1 Tax=Acetobacter lambici TaxID=1332824 RepID=A0ABT1EY47_9PROT|nr:hypothetical protein [Acetobacter lambici]MCP1241733.1 hypothetical protein [Acetobacter lambici]MCP1257858.1 hypothetical protein [Acetobacter lambici]NHO56566.1 hypothetical protein [Acetobacter lambici]
MTTVNLYYCHSPICAHLALKQAEAVGDAERHVFIAARNTAVSRAVFTLQKDVFETRQEFLTFVRDISAFVDGLCAPGDHLRVFVPHAAALPTRMLLCHKRVDSVYFMEEGSAYYVEQPDNYALTWPDYITTFDLNEQDIIDLAVILGRTTDEHVLVFRSLTECFHMFHDICQRVVGLLITHEEALASLSYRDNLHIIVRPLEPMFKVPLERAVLYMLGPHHQSLTEHGAPLDDVIKTHKEIIRVLLMTYERVIIKPHPADMYFWLDIVHNYQTTPEVTTFAQLRLTSYGDKPFEGEPSVLNFAGFYLGHSSSRLYVIRLWGTERIVDHDLGVGVAPAGPVLQGRVENTAGMQYAFPSAFVMLPGQMEPTLTHLLDTAGLVPTRQASLESVPWAVLPGGTYRLSNGSNCTDFSFPQSSSLFFIRSIRDCLCGILNTLLSHNYGQATPPIARILLSCANDEERMLRFLAEVGEQFLKQTLFGPMARFIFLPGVLTLRVPDRDEPDYATAWQDALLKIRDHLNLPAVGSGGDALPAAAGPVEGAAYSALRARYWSDAAEARFVGFGGDRIQAFYDFEKSDLSALRAFIGHWGLFHKIIIQILPNGTVISRAGHLGRVFASSAGQLVIVWDNVPQIYYLQFEGPSGRYLAGWTNYGEDIFASRW